MATNRQVLINPNFLNVDLEIRSRRDLQPLLTFWGDQALLHAARVGRIYCASLEVRRYFRKPTADGTIRGFCSLIRKLPPKERELWDTAFVRDFNIGFDAGYSTTVITAAALETTVEVGARIVITVYGRRSESSRGRGRVTKPKARSIGE